MSIAEKFVAMEYGPAPEDPKEVLTWLDYHGRRFGHFIDGAWQPPTAGHTSKHGSLQRREARRRSTRIGDGY